jgi:hypothetical protein
MIPAPRGRPPRTGLDQREDRRRYRSATPLTTCTRRAVSEPALGEPGLSGCECVAARRPEPTSQSPPASYRTWNPDILRGQCPRHESNMRTRFRKPRLPCAKWLQTTRFSRRGHARQCSRQPRVKTDALGCEVIKPQPVHKTGPLTQVASRGIIARTGERRPNGPAIESRLRIAAAGRRSRSSSSAARVGSTQLRGTDIA